MNDWRRAQISQGFVGHLLTAEPQTEEPTSEVTLLRWLPGGKRLCFVYKNALYTVPTN